MQTENFRGKTQAELQDTLYELLQERFNLRMQAGAGQLARPHLVKNVRKNIARVKTLINEKKGKS